MAMTTSLQPLFSSASLAPRSVVGRRARIEVARPVPGKVAPCRRQHVIAMAAADPDDPSAIEPFSTRGSTREDFDWGHEDGHHTWHESEEDELVEFKKSIEESLQLAGGPTGINLGIAIAFPLAVTGALLANVPIEFVVAGSCAAVSAYCAVEMGAQWGENARLNAARFVDIDRVYAERMELKKKKDAAWVAADEL